MNTVNKWVRQLHRWLSIGLMTTVAILLFKTIQMGPDFVFPPWMNVLGIGSLLSLLVTGIYLFGLHYISKLRRAVRMKRRARAVAETSGESAF